MLRANFQQSYLWRYLIMACVGIFMAGWFAFDGLVTYPNRLERLVVLEELKSEISDRTELQKKWEAVAESRGWPIERPDGDDKNSDQLRMDIQGQYFFGVLSLLLGLPALYFYLKSKRQWVEETEDGLTTSWGQQVRFADVTQLNKKKWDRKGIARAYYTEAGKQRTFVFDDFKFEREPLGKILRKLEDVLEPDKIVGGISEAERDQQKKAAAE